MAWDKIIGAIFGWIPPLLGYAVGNQDRDKKIESLEREAERMEKELEIIRRTVGDINIRVIGLELLAKDLDRRIGDITGDLHKVRDKVLKREFKDEGEKEHLRVQLKRMVTDLDRLLTSVRRTRMELESRSKEQEVARVLETLLQISRGVGGKRNSINTLLNRLDGQPDDSNPSPVAV